MAEVVSKSREWIVVCDGAKALVFENTGDALTPKLETREVYQQEDPATRELGTAAPGRIMNSVGTARSAVEQTDWHDREERSFLEDLAKRLDAALEAGQFRSLVLVAPPRALGVIRGVYSQALRDAMRAEIDKDLVKMPVPEIEKHLAA
jgi:protein required for attachment to host cells